LRKGVYFLEADLLQSAIALTTVSNHRAVQKIPGSVTE
jgi:hypothetical protein